MNSEQDFTPIIELLALKLNSGAIFSEYDLLRWLQEPEQAIFRADALRENKTLFQSHFIVMHCLYNLRQYWANSQTALLEISALHIQKCPWPQQSETDLPTKLDPLAAYYLNLNELDTSESDIEHLLTSFWQRMLQPETEQADLLVLELDVPVTAAKIRLNYRRLAMKYHPDRGGDVNRFREIQTAYQRLRQRYL